jgi:hypothetical protein
MADYLVFLWFFNALIMSRFVLSLLFLVACIVVSLCLGG